MDLPASIARALAIPANDETGSIHDVKHVVVMMQGRSFDIFREDVLADRLPQVSWIVAPEAYTEHGNWPSNFGAWYVSQMLDALTANAEVWSKTVFFYSSTRTMASSTTWSRPLRHSCEHKESPPPARLMNYLPAALRTPPLSSLPGRTATACACR